MAKKAVRPKSHRYEILEVEPQNIPTAADHREVITLVVPSGIQCNFQDVAAVFRIIHDNGTEGNVEPTASGNIDDIGDGTWELHGIFNSTPKGRLKIILQKEDCEVVSSEKTYLKVR
jgi:hypothetical protein